MYALQLLCRNGGQGGVGMGFGMGWKDAMEDGRLEGITNQEIWRDGGRRDASRKCNVRKCSVRKCNVRKCKLSVGTLQQEKLWWWISRANIQTRVDSGFHSDTMDPWTHEQTDT
jgi:hypothetical protein